MSMKISQTVNLKCDRCDKVMKVPFNQDAEDVTRNKVRITARKKGWYIRGPRTDPEEVLCPECGSLENIRRRVNAGNAKSLIIPHPETTMGDEIREQESLRRSAFTSAMVKVKSACDKLKDVDDPADSIEDVADASSLLRKAIGRTEMTSWDLGLEDIIDSYL